MAARNYVLRSVYLEPEIDNFLREQAFNLALSKNDLIRHYVVAGAKAELVAAMSAPAKSKLSRPASTSVLRAARVAKIIDQFAPAEKVAAGAGAGRMVVKKAAKKAAVKTASKKAAVKKAAKKVVVKKAAKKAAKLVGA